MAHHHYVLATERFAASLEGRLLLRKVDEQPRDSAVRMAYLAEAHRRIKRLAKQIASVERRKPQRDAVEPTVWGASRADRRHAFQRARGLR